MPTIIDSLIVRFGLDSSDLNSKSSTVGTKLKDLEKQSAKTESGVKKIGATSKESAAGVDTLTRSVGRFLALLGGTVALRAFVEDTIASNAALDRFAKNLGLSVGDVSAWSNAVEELGGSAKGVQGSMDMLSKAQTELRLTGQSGLIPYFSALGVSLATVGGQARPVDQILLDLSDRFSHMDRTTANNMGRMMGLDQDTLNLLLQGRREVELMIARQKEFGAVSKAQAAEASKLQRSIIDLKQQFTAFARDLLYQASPALEKILGMFASLATWAKDNRQFVGEFLAVMAVGLGAVAIAAIPINGVILAVTALGAAITLLYQDYQTWKRGGESFIDWAKWKPEIELATKAITLLGDAMARVAGLKNPNDPGAKGYTGGLHPLKDNAPGWNAANGGTIAEQAKRAAAMVSRDTGIPADLIFGQWAVETNGFKHIETANNLAGIETGDTQSWNSIDDFAKYYEKVITNKRYASRGILAAKTPEEFARALRGDGTHDLYFTGDKNKTNDQNIQDYAGGMSRFIREYGYTGASGNVAAAGGSRSSTPGNTDKSVSVQTGDITINTQATDATGIARDWGKSMNYLFTSHANSGLF